jgi:uncharacterized protein YlxP (DUF503 family)
MLIASTRFDLRIPGVQSLKEKRHVVKGLTAGIRQRFNVSVAEVEHQELWQRAAIGVAVVTGEGYHARKVLHEVERYVSTWPAVEIIDTDTVVMDPEDE